MPADRGLRQLDDVAELGNRELAAFQNGEHPDADRIRKDGELIDDGRIHPYNRMKEYDGGRRVVKHRSAVSFPFDR